MDRIADFPSKSDRQDSLGDTLQVPPGYEEEFEIITADLDPSDNELGSGVFSPEDDLALAPDEVATQEVQPQAEDAFITKAIGGTGLDAVAGDEENADQGEADRNSTEASGVIDDRHARPGPVRRLKDKLTPGDDGSKEAPKDQPVSEVPAAEERAFSGAGDGQPPDQNPPDTGGDNDPERSRVWKEYMQRHNMFVEAYRPEQTDGLSEKDRQAAGNVLLQVDRMIQSKGPARDDIFDQATAIPEDQDIAVMVEAAREAAEGPMPEQPEGEPSEQPAYRSIYERGESVVREFPPDGEGIEMGVPRLVLCEYTQHLRGQPGDGNTGVTLKSYRQGKQASVCKYDITTRQGEGDRVVIRNVAASRILPGQGSVEGYTPGAREMGELYNILGACLAAYENRQ